MAFFLQINAVEENSPPSDVSSFELAHRAHRQEFGNEGAVGFAFRRRAFQVVPPVRDHNQQRDRGIRRRGSVLKGWACSLNVARGVDRR